MNLLARTGATAPPKYLPTTIAVLISFRAHSSPYARIVYVHKKSLRFIEAMKKYGTLRNVAVAVIKF